MINTAPLLDGPIEDDVVELDDGSALVPDPDFVQEQSMPLAFDDNLVEFLPQNKLNAIASEFCDLIEKDMRSREERDKQYQEGIQRTGLGNDAPGGAQFEGASRVVHPVLAEACVDYASATIKEIFPPEGPVKMHFLSAGNSPDSIEKAENKRDFLNWQMTNQIVEYKTELEVLFTQQPLGGSQYLKFWYDTTKRRIRAEFIPVDKLYLPFAASSFLVAQRFTILDSITDFELKRRVKSGLYSDIGLSGTSLFPDESNAQLANDKVEGRDQVDDNADGLRDIYEVHAFYDVEGEGEYPYVITIDKETERVLSIYRNWDEQDPLLERLEWVVEFPFIPWRGAYGIGLLHLIGGLSAAATGALRALLDSALINNFPGAVKLKGGKNPGQSLSIGPMEVAELDAPPNVDDIRKTIMAMPFNPPSAVLMQLLGWLTDAAKGVVSTAEEKISDATNQMPVGTAMALIEQGSKVFSAIHARQHDAQKRSLAIIQRLNARYYDEETQVRVFGKVLVTQQDFANVGNVVPVSDPNIFSESQRFAQVQSILQMSQDQSVQWNKQAIYKRILRLMHVEAPQEFLIDPPQPVSADPTTEIVTAMSGKPIQPTPDMDHLTHMREELSYLLDPIFGMPNQSLMSPGYQTLLGDIYQHLLFTYQQFKQQALQTTQQQVAQMLSMQLTQASFAQPMPIPPEQIQMMVQQQMQSPQVQQMVLQRASQVFEQMKQQLQPYVQMMNQASTLHKEKLKQEQENAPMDPQSQAALQVSRMQEETRLQVAQMRDENEKLKLQMTAQQDHAELQLKTLVETQIKPMLEKYKSQVDLQKNSEDNIAYNATETAKNTDDNIANIRINEDRDRARFDQAVTVELLRQERDREQKQIDAQNERVNEVLKASLERSLEQTTLKGDENGNGR